MPSSLLLACGLLLLILCSPTSAFDRFGKNKNKAKAKPAAPRKPVLLNTDGLPTLPEILEEVQLTAFLPQFIRMGVTETMLLLRLTSMDYRIMVMDWEGVSEEAVNALKERAAALYLRAIVPEEVEQPNYDERAKLKYGRLYVPGAVQSFEYVTASFGGAPPRGVMQVALAPPPYFGCDISDFAASDSVEATAGMLTGQLLVVRRGTCSFLQKALVARHLNASALVVCNHEDRLDALASGHGIDPNVTQAMVDDAQGVAILSVSNTTWPKLAFSAHHATPTHPVMAHCVPLKCGPGGICMPLLPEEKALQAEVSWGSARFRSVAKEVRSFEFLTSNFGGRLPEDHESLPVVLARPLHGCVEGEATEDPAEALWAKDLASREGAFALAVVRGQCRFHVKQAWAESLGARLLIIIDSEDAALQRVGGLLPEAGNVGMPSILVTAPAGDFLQRAAQDNAGGSTNVSLTAALDTSGADKWIELAFTEWAEGDGERLLQIQGLSSKHSQGDNVEIVSWLRRRAVEIEARAPGRSKIPTDEL